MEIVSTETGLVNASFHNMANFLVWFKTNRDHFTGDQLDSVWYVIEEILRVMGPIRHDHRTYYYDAPMCRIDVTEHWLGQEVFSHMVPYPREIVQRFFWQYRYFESRNFQYEVAN